MNNEKNSPNYVGPSVWAAIHVLHSGHFLSWDMGTPHDCTSDLMRALQALLR